MRLHFRTLRAFAAGSLLLAGAAALAASPTSGDDSLASLQSAYGRAVTPGEHADLYRELLANVLKRVQRSYATEVDLSALAAAALNLVEPLAPGTGNPAQVFSKAMNAALATLDPYSRYLDARAYGNERGDSNGRFGGLGLEVESSLGGVRVVAPISDSPAARAGVRPGDLILRVDDQSLIGMPLADAIARMRGQPGTQVSLTIRRTGLDNDISVSLTRDTIRRQALRWNMEGDVLVLRVGTFSGSVAAALQQAIADATASQAPRGVVLDLRGNPGGLLREAVMTADTFLSEGEIVSLRGRTAANQRTWHADAAELLAGVRLVVLIDRRSASASELVAAALQENGRATVMGERSFGKGTVQSTYALGEETKGALKLTTSFYHGPSGRSVHKTGVAPDIELVNSVQRQGARGEEDRHAAPPATGQSQLPKVRVEQDRCAPANKAATDPALSCALAYLHAGDRELFLARVSGEQH
ncbi:MAG: S41 family peptidase [Variovorax sp.]